MGNLSKENLEKLRALRAQLEETGFELPAEVVLPKEEGVVIQPDTKEEVKEDRLRISELSEEEKQAIEKTASVWEISFAQATMIYRTVGTIQGLQMTNVLRQKLQKKELTYERIERRLSDNDSIVKGYEALSEKYFSNYERIMGGQEFPVTVSFLRKENEEFERRIEELRPQAERARRERDALCATIYYGMMVDLLRAKEQEEKDQAEYRRQEEGRLLPGLKIKEFGEE